MSQRIVDLRYSTDTLWGRRCFNLQYVGVTPSRARRLFNATIRPKLVNGRLLSIKRLR